MAFAGEHLCSAKFPSFYFDISFNWSTSMVLSLQYIYQLSEQLHFIFKASETELAI